MMIAAFLKIITQPRSKGLVHVENLDLFAVLIDIAMSVAKLLAAKFIKSVQNRIAIKLQVYLVEENFVEFAAMESNVKFTSEKVSTGIGIKNLLIILLHYLKL